MAQFSLNGTTQPAHTMEEGQSPTMDRSSSSFRRLCFTAAGRPASRLTTNLCPLPLPPSCLHYVSLNQLPSMLLVCPVFFYLRGSSSLFPVPSRFWLLPTHYLPISILTVSAFVEHPVNLFFIILIPS